MNANKHVNAAFVSSNNDKRNNLNYGRNALCTQDPCYIFHANRESSNLNSTPPGRDPTDRYDPSDEIEVV
jgi:hypothetical protein